MNIPKEAAIEALNNLENLMDNLDFVGCTTDEEYSFFLVQIATLREFIKNADDGTDDWDDYK